MRALLLGAVGIALAFLLKSTEGSQPSPCSIFCIREASYDYRPGFTIEKIHGTIDTMWVGRDAIFGPNLVREAEYVLSPYATPGILLYLTEDGRERFNKYAEFHRKESIAIFVAGKLLLAPVIMGLAEDQKLLIEGKITESEAKEFVSQLNAAKRRGVQLGIGADGTETSLGYGEFESRQGLRQARCRAAARFQCYAATGMGFPA